MRMLRHASNHSPNVRKKRTSDLLFLSHQRSVPFPQCLQCCGQTLYMCCAENSIHVRNHPFQSTSLRCDFLKGLQHDIQRVRKFQLRNVLITQCVVQNMRVAPLRCCMWSFRYPVILDDHVRSKRNLQSCSHELLSEYVTCQICSLLINFKCC